MVKSFRLFFEEYENEDAFNQTALYLLLSISYEFPPFEPTIEWFDGRECSGGADILNYKLTRNALQLWLNNGLSFDVSFKINDSTSLLSCAWLIVYYCLNTDT